MTSCDGVFLVFANTLNVVCWSNLRFTRSIISAGFVAAVEDPTFRDAYLNGTANYAPFVPNNARSSNFVSLFTINAQSSYAAAVSLLLRVCIWERRGLPKGE
jgi:hypothetical protein